MSFLKTAIYEQASVFLIEEFLKGEKIKNLDFKIILKSRQYF